MNRAALFASLRSRTSGVFGTSLSQGQVTGIEGIIDEALRRRTFKNHLAYMLATTYHETAHTMQPIHERGGRAYFNKYDAGTPIGKRLGNTVKGDGYLYRGRGLVQITGRSNYAKASKKLGVDFIKDPDRVLEPKLAIAIMFAGMEEGWFTGKDLLDYIDLEDEADAEDLREYANARRIINGTDKAAQIGKYAIAFENALAAAGYGEEAAAPPAPIPTPKPRPASPVGTSETVAQKPKPSTGLAALIEAILKIFRRKA
ncbi:MAG: glycoside hydrolase family 19 protein [Pseudorhizobium sp.]